MAASLPTALHADVRAAPPRLPSRYFFQRFSVFDYAMSVQLPRLVQLLAEQAERENVLVRPASLV